MNVLKFIGSIFTHHKKKLMLFSLASFIFTLILFPFSDLSDSITDVVARQTNNTVYVQFDDVSLAFIPQPALKVNQLVAEMQNTPTITADEFSIAPSIFALFKKKPLGRVYSEGLFRGNLDLSLSQSRQMKSAEAVNANINYENFQLREITRDLQRNQVLPFTLSGTGSLKAQMDVDPSMKNQPDGDVQMLLQNLQVPAFSVPMPYGGALEMPGLNLQKLQVKGQLKNGRLQLQDTLLGSPSDDLSGKVSGTMDVRMGANMSGVQVGAYNLAVDLTLKDNLVNQLSLYMPLLDGFVGKFKQGSISGVRYSFRVQANSTFEPPQFTAL